MTSQARLLFDQHVEIPAHLELGSAIEADIRSSLSPFLFFPEYKTQYPTVVIEALGNLYSEYNAAFTCLVEKNREWDTDYRYCMAGPGGSPINFVIQIDMVGLPQGFLEAADDLGEKEVREALRGRIFEIENSLAMYQLVERVFSSNGQDSFFKKRFRASLNEVRQQYGMPIALLAVTDEKYQAMRESEFGKRPQDSLSDAEVIRLSGFDRFFGPKEFQEYVAQNRGECHYLLYARTSDPVTKLKKPDASVEHPLLGNPDMRRLIKAHTLTLNIDAPEMVHTERINDTKEYMPCMGMAFRTDVFTDIITPGLIAHMSQGRAYADYSCDRLSRNFTTYMKIQGFDPAEVESGEIILRAKPMKGAYGCYGHVSGELTNMKFRNELRSNLRKRGPYVLQHEMRVPVIINKTDRREYAYIDRNFFAFTSEQPRFLGGFRSLMPVDSTEAQKGRIHGNSSTIWAEIT